MIGSPGQSLYPENRCPFFGTGRLRQRKKAYDKSSAWQECHQKHSPENQHSAAFVVRGERHQTETSISGRRRSAFPRDALKRLYRSCGCLAFFFLSDIRPTEE